MHTSAGASAKSHSLGAAGQGRPDAFNGAVSPFAILFAGSMGAIDAQQFYAALAAIIFAIWASGTAQSFMSRPRIAFSDDAIKTVRFSSEGPMTSSK